MFEFFENLNNTRSDSPFLLVQSYIHFVARGCLGWVAKALDSAGLHAEVIKKCRMFGKV
jgi:hypothetical protein